MGMKPRKPPALPTPPKIPEGPHEPDPDCKDCKGTGYVTKTWAAPAGRIGFNMWREACFCGLLLAIKKEIQRDNELITMSRADWKKIPK